MPNEFIGVDEVCCQASCSLYPSIKPQLVMCMDLEVLSGLILIFESYWHLAVRIVLSNVGTHQLL